MCVFYVKNILKFWRGIFCKKVPPPFISAIDFDQNGHEKTLKMWQKSRSLRAPNLMISGPFCMFFSKFSLYPAYYFQKMPCRNEFVVVWCFPYWDRAKSPLSMGFRVTGSELAIKWSKNTTYHRQHRFQMFLIWTRNESFWWHHRLAVSTVIFEISLKNRFWDSIKMIILEGVWYRQPPAVLRISVLIDFLWWEMPNTQEKMENLSKMLQKWQDPDWWFSISGIREKTVNSFSPPYPLMELLQPHSRNVCVVWVPMQ